MGAAVSYYAVFSIAPLCVLIISIAGAFLGTLSVETTVARYIGEGFGPATGTLVKNLVQTAHQYPLGVGATIAGALSLVIAALGVLSELDSDLDELWATGPERISRRKQSHAAYIRSFVWKKIIAFSVIPIFGLLFVGTTVISDISLSAFNLGGIAPESIDALMSFILGTLLFALVFRILPDTKLPKRELLLGGLVTSTLFLVGKILINIYVENINTAAFGAAGSFVVLLIWIYYSAQVFFLGASFTYVYAKNHGSLSEKAASE
jgi:membrane protein